MARRLFAWRTCLAVAVGVVSLSTGMTTAHAAAPLGALIQLPGTAGCFTFDGSSEDGALTCGVGRGFGRGESAILSPGGQNLYVGSYNGSSPARLGSLTVFSRSAVSGQLTQLTGGAGCFTTDGSSLAGPGTCTEARGMGTIAGDGRDIVFTSDGLWAYLVVQRSGGGTSGRVLIFQRDLATGALTQLAGTAGCISIDGSSQDGPSTCQTDAKLVNPMGVSISSDDRFLYVTDFGPPYRMHVFSRAPSGALTDIQCLSQAPAPAGCTTGRVLGNSQSLVLAGDGQHAYGGNFDLGLSVFNRDSTTGLLTQKPGAAGCITQNGTDDAGNATCATGRDARGSYAISISPDGQTLYETSFSGGLTVWHINGDGSLSQLSGTDGCISPNGLDNNGDPTCATARGVLEPYGSAISPDGAYLYISDDYATGGVAVFSLDAATGRATQLPGLAGCTTSDGSSGTTAGQCTDGRAVGTGYGISVSQDGNFVYQATVDQTNAGLAIYARERGPRCSSTSVAVPHAKPATVTLACTDTDGDPVTPSIVAGPSHGTLGPVAGGKVTYTPAPAYHGADGFTFAGSDGLNSSAPATATLTVAPGFGGSALVSKILIVDSRFRAKIKVRCAADAPTGSCADVVSLYSANGTLPRNARRKKAVLLGRGRFSVPAGKTVTRRFRLNKAGRKLARAHKRFPARLSLKATSGASASSRHVYKVTVKRAKTRR